MERDENDLDGDGSHPQKHAKSPELAREFLLDAAAVIFKEQVIYCENSRLIRSSTCIMILTVQRRKRNIPILQILDNAYQIMDNAYLF
jgi:hypothetical protein